MLEFLPIIAIAIAATFLLVTLIIGVRTGNIFPAKLEFHFRNSPDLPSDLAKRLRNKPPVAIAFVNRRINAATQAIRLPLFVRNISGKKIGDVTISLTYPEAYFIHNDEHRAAIEEAQKLFPVHARELGMILRQLDMRECLMIGDLVTVRYNIGLLRLGEFFGCEELMRLPPKGKAFADVRYRDRLFGSILDRLRALPQLLGVCHIQASVLSDAMRPLRRSITAIAGHCEFEDAQTEILNPFAEAHWLNEMPRGQRFRRIRPSLSLPGRPLPNLVEEATVDLFSQRGKYEVVAGNTVILVSNWIDDPTPLRGFSVMEMPGYNYFRLSRRIETVEQAIRSIGFLRMPRKAKQAESEAR